MLDYNDAKQKVNFIYAQGNVSFDSVLVLGREVQNLAVHHSITENRFNRNTYVSLSWILTPCLKLFNFQPHRKIDLKLLQHIFQENRENKGLIVYNFGKLPMVRKKLLPVWLFDRSQGQAYMRTLVKAVLTFGIKSYKELSFKVSQA